MKRFVLALFLSLSCCGLSLADDETPTTDFGDTVAEVVETAKVTCTNTIKAVDRVGIEVTATLDGLQRIIPFLKSKGVPEEALAPLDEASATLIAALKDAQPLFKEGIVRAEYAAILSTSATTTAESLEAAAEYCRAAACFKAAGEALDGTEAVVEEVTAKVRELLESLKNIPTPDDSEIAAPDGLIREA